VIPNSTGGGRGGYCFAGARSDPLIFGPDDCTNWGGDARRQNGGLGGRPFNAAQTNLYFGGGGGAGHLDQSQGGSGGRGGGLVFIIADKIQATVSFATTPSIRADGGNGGNSVDFLGLYDGPGGGGAGGSIYIQLPIGPASSNAFDSRIIVSAKGGKGGDQEDQPFNFGDESMGGGGAGGGGAVYINAPITADVSSGAAGISKRSWLISKFAPNGATQGCDGTQATAVCIMPSPSPSSSPSPTSSISISASPTPSESVSRTVSPSLTKEPSGNSINNHYYKVICRIDPVRCQSEQHSFENCSSNQDHRDHRFDLQRHTLR